MPQRLAEWTCRAAISTSPKCRAIGSSLVWESECYVPGGIGLTEKLLRSLSIGPSDDVVEFAPSLGVTARLILERQPRYVGVERDVKAMRWTTRQLPQQPNVKSIFTCAQD